MAGETDLIFVGGFLGAGKTTLLREAAARLTARGRRVGLIANDQAPQLVDTALLAASGPVEEVAGSCFCCDYDGLVEAIDRLRAEGADTILAEPVGSCTDLAATLVRPLQAQKPDIRVLPLTVLVDPDRLLDLLDADRGAGLHQATAYIARLQLKEADRVLLTKRDSFPDSLADAVSAVAARALPEITTAWVSATEGTGVDAWLDDVLAGGESGTRRIEVDYDRYALGEAVLGWLNATLRLPATDHELPIAIVRELADRCRAAQAPIGHVKAFAHGEGWHARAQLTRTDEALQQATQPGRGPGTLVLNARVQCTPEALQQMTSEVLAPLLDEGATLVELDCFSPGYPRPTHRLA